MVRPTVSLDSLSRQLLALRTVVRCHSLYQAFDHLAYSVVLDRHIEKRQYIVASTICSLVS